MIKINKFLGLMLITFCLLESTVGISNALKYYKIIQFINGLFFILIGVLINKIVIKKEFSFKDGK